LTEIRKTCEKKLQKNDRPPEAMDELRGLSHTAAKRLRGKKQNGTRTKKAIGRKKQKGKLQ